MFFHRENKVDRIFNSTTVALLEVDKKREKDGGKKRSEHDVIFAGGERIWWAWILPSRRSSHVQTSERILSYTSLDPASLSSFTTRRGVTRQLAPSAPACNGPGHWRVAVLMNFELTFCAKHVASSRCIGHAHTVFAVSPISQYSKNFERVS